MNHLAAILLLAPRAAAQTWRVPLEIRPDEPSMGKGLAIETGADGRLRASLPGGGELRIERMPPPLSGILVRIPDGDDEKVVALLASQGSAVSLGRAVGNAKSAVYDIGYNRSERDGKVMEYLHWSSRYRAEGKLVMPGCELRLAAIDFNGDGRFDRNDSLNATTLAIDLDSDGRFFGQREWRKMAEIVELCGVPLQVAELDPAGLSITFRASEIQAPKIGDRIPSFSVSTTDGRLLRSDELRGKVHVLDFWASWCAPCVETLDTFNTLAREREAKLGVYGINVDEPSRRAAADRILKEKSLSYPQAIRERGENDFLWKMFGSMVDVRLSIPLIVVVDRQGIIRYAGGDVDRVRALLPELL